MTLDFSKSSKILKNNFNTPTAVTKSVVIYFLRTLIEDNLPLNEGALKDIEIRFSENSMLNPKHPSPVVAGNVETSQTLIDVLNGALEIQAACYGTMSNVHLVTDILVTTRLYAVEKEHLKEITEPIQYIVI